MELTQEVPEVDPTVTMADATGDPIEITARGGGVHLTTHDTTGDYPIIATAELGPETTFALIAALADAATAALAQRRESA